MAMNQITFNFRAKLAELEAAKDHRYTHAEIARKSGHRMTRQHVRLLLSKTSTRVDMDTLGALLDFFAAEGMPIGVADLFTVEQTK